MLQVLNLGIICVISFVVPTNIVELSTTSSAMNLKPTGPAENHELKGMEK